MTIRTVSTLAEANAAWTATKGGDAVVWAQGATILDFRPVNKTLTPRATIDTTPGTVGGMYGGHGGGLNLKIGKVIPGTKFPHGVRFDSMNDITIDASQSDCQGPSDVDASAVEVNGGNNVLIFGVKSKGFMNGVVVIGVTNARVTGGDHTGMGGDGIDYAAAVNLRIDHNRCYDGKHVDSKHPDAIQGSSPAGKQRCDNIEIDHNSCGAGLQGFTFFDHQTQGQLGIGTIHIHDNEVFGSYPQAIAVTDGDHVIVEDNAVSTQPNSQWQATINLTNCKTVERYSNTVAPYLKWKGITDPPRPVALGAAA